MSIYQSMDLEGLGGFKVPRTPLHAFLVKKWLGVQVHLMQASCSAVHEDVATYS